jgi:hypothetical protein
MLEEKGTKTIRVQALTTDTKRVTVAVTVTVSCKLLKAFLVFKGKVNRRIETNEFQTYPEECIYACQSKAWTDKAMMHKWIDLVLIPWRNTRNHRVGSLLILDVYHMHMMG